MFISPFAKGSNYLYELTALGEKTYFIDCPTRIGIYKINEKDVCLIDSGNNPDAGKKVLKICEEQGWQVINPEYEPNPEEEGEAGGEEPTPDAPTEE